MKIKYTRWLRSYVGHQRIMQVRACAFTRNEAGHVLLCRRADVMLWDVPGGTLGLDEVPAHAMVREVQEETGLVLVPERLIGVYGGPDYHWTYPNGDQAQIFTIFFAARIVGGALLPAGHENVNVGFFPVEQLPPLLARTRPMLQDALAGREAASFER
ncbi:NUDIX domain-containing protein [Candidatus Viridilinea mediisalina]|uniref:NUDIX hydrolase n=1 Tax=Candidatus Viridilinea mediisalina TaxID=2024553 RepID=A0A2A6RF89_9CHLR|nr:NUDIX domain-containing protein [Candidatus Viridilinea mediisalina]PDW01747.1 NUDIX hydrolase [Candidatus Viridilinea mediisalina]